MLFSCWVMSNFFVTPWTICSLTGFSVHGIFQAKILECVAISFSRGSSQSKDHWTCISCIGRRFLYHWATRKAPIKKLINLNVKKKIPTSFILFICPPMSLLREAIPDLPPSLPSLFYFFSEHIFLLHVKQCSIHLVD